MRSAAFDYAGFTIKTFVTQEGVKARVFLDNIWVQDVPDVVGSTIEDALRQAQHSLEYWGTDDEEDATLH
jgi:hypothetical protein